MKKHRKSSHILSKAVKVDVSNPRIHNCDKGKYVDYEVKIETDNIAFSRKNSCVRRRYSDFIWIRNKLSTQEISGFASDYPVPELPPKRLFGRFEPKFVHSRMCGLKEFLEKVLNQRHFLSFVGLHLFLQTEMSMHQIENYVNGNYGQEYTVEDLIHLSESNQIEKALDTCTLKSCYNVVISDFDTFVMVNSNGEQDDAKSFHSASMGSIDSNSSINTTGLSTIGAKDYSVCIHCSVK
ncbi:sorting nexin-10B [Exaiptasia diaphana]|uniref:PX domain-containing protein n=1 Tax=Exaiptasia diaphana TaxID=2652724 RepID=A0A913X9Q8_EXADI|nr:sorting nexin-10B [Exaiptasia diaphana]KXJ13692.1 Sorting nexin-11 [Exaiptasia diaphana]